MHQLLRNAENVGLTVFAKYHEMAQGKKQTDLSLSIFTTTSICKENLIFISQLLNVCFISPLLNASSLFQTHLLIW